MATKFLVGCSRRTASHSCMTICSTPYESVLCKYSIYRVSHMASRRTGSWRRQVAQQAFKLKVKTPDGRGFKSRRARHGSRAQECWSDFAGVNIRGGYCGGRLSSDFLGLMRWEACMSAVVPPVLH